MGLIDQLKSAGDQASSRARKTVEETQLKHELTLAYGALGEIAYGLVERGVVSDAGLSAGAERIRSLRTRLAALERT